MDSRRALARTRLFCSGFVGMVPRQLALCSHRARAVAVVLGRHLAWDAVRVVRKQRLRLVFHEWIGVAFLYGTGLWVHSDGESSREGPDVEGPDVEGPFLYGAGLVA